MAVGTMAVSADCVQTILAKCTVADSPHPRRAPPAIATVTNTGNFMLCGWVPVDLGGVPRVVARANPLEEHDSHDADQEVRPGNPHDEPPRAAGRPSATAPRSAARRRR